VHRLKLFTFIFFLALPRFATSHLPTAAGSLRAIPQQEPPVSGHGHVPPARSLPRTAQPPSPAASRGGRRAEPARGRGQAGEARAARSGRGEATPNAAPSRNGRTRRAPPVRPHAAEQPSPQPLRRDAPGRVYLAAILAPPEHPARRLDCAPQPINGRFAALGPAYVGSMTTRQGGLGRGRGEGVPGPGGRGGAAPGRAFSPGGCEGMGSLLAVRPLLGEQGSFLTPRRAPEGSDGPTRASEVVLSKLTAVLWKKSR